MVGRSKTAFALQICSALIHASRVFVSSIHLTSTTTLIINHNGWQANGAQTLGEAALTYLEKSDTCLQAACSYMLSVIALKALMLLLPYLTGIR